MERINSQTMKLNNAMIIVETLRRQAPLSRAALAKTLGLTSAAITNLVARLIEKNVLLETGVADSAKGRRPILLDINPEACYVIGVMFTTDDFRIVLFDFKLRPLISRNLDINIYADANFILDRICEGVESLLLERGITKDDILGIGIACPGPLDSRRGILIDLPNFPNIRNVPICELLEQRLGIHACCDRESNAAALAEVNNGIAADYRTVFYLVLLKNSVGGSIVSNGNILHGFCDGAGEIGHMLIDINGPRCTCGHFGCLEALIKGDALVNEARAKIRTMDNLNLSVPCSVDELTLEDVFRLSVLKIPIFAEIVDKAARNIAIAIGNVITLFSPELVVIGGAKETMDSHFVGLIKEYAGNRKYPSHARNVKIETTALGDMACVLGAASLVVESYEDKLCGDDII